MSLVESGKFQKHVLVVTSLAALLAVSGFAYKISKEKCASGWEPSNVFIYNDDFVPRVQEMIITRKGNGGPITLRGDVCTEARGFLHARSTPKGLEGNKGRYSIKLILEDGTCVDVVILWHGEYQEMVMYLKSDRLRTFSGWTSAGFLDQFIDP